MQCRDHYAVLSTVEERKGEALVAAGIVKRAETDEPNVPDDAREYVNYLVVLFLHAGHGLCRVSHRPEVLCQHSGGIAVAGISKNCVQACIDPLRVAMDSQHPKAHHEHYRQEHEPKNERVLIVREVNRVDVNLAEVRSNAEPV